MLGEADAYAAYTNFFTAWVGELETIAGGLTELTDGMRASAMSYRDADLAEGYGFGAGLVPDSGAPPVSGPVASGPMGAVGQALDFPGY